jgi:Peptidase family C25/Right handed beta helix region
LRLAESSLALIVLAVLLAAPSPLSAAQLRSLQSGSATIANASTVATVTLSPAVTANQAFLVFSMSLNANTPADGGVTGKLAAGGNQITFQRVGTTGAITVQWYVAEFASGVTVQRGTADLTLGVPFNQALTPVNPARSFPILSHRAAGSNINANDFVRGEITGAGSNLQLSYLCCGSSTSPETVEWQVVEYQQASVQTGNLFFADVDTSRTATLAPAVNPDKSWLLFTSQCDVDCPDDANMGAKIVRGAVTNGTTLTFDRSVTGTGESLHLTWYLVEFTDQTVVRRGSTAFSAAASQQGAVFAPVTREASIVTAGGAYHRGGRTSLTTDDNIGMGTVTLDLVTPTNLVIRRGVTGAAADIGWFVVSFVQTNYRSIGNLATTYAVNTVAVTQGSNVVTGSGTLWMTANRGRGDRININGTNYTIYSVDSETQLRLTNPYAGATNASRPYTISRQFGTLATWEDCVDGATVCGAFPAMPTGNLVSEGRSEVGIAYKDNLLAGGLVIDGSTTDALHTITLTADGVNRHYGVPNQGVGIDNTGRTTPAVSVQDDFVTVEWMEIFGGTNSAGHGIEVTGLAPGAGSLVVIRNNRLANLGGSGLEVTQGDARVDVINNFISATRRGINITAGQLMAGSRYRVLNNTIYLNAQKGIFKQNGNSPAATLLLRNNISHSNGAGNDFDCDPGDSVDPASSNNLSLDTTATAHSPGLGGQPSIPLGPCAGCVNFVNAAAGDLHIQGTSYAIDKAVDLSAVFTIDIDAGVRKAPWDIGADDFAVATAVKLTSFEAHPRDSEVELSWETASEIDNLGFHLYRAMTEVGPYERITSFPVPGLGSSPAGARYRFVDRGLVNDATYFYQLEDIETTGKTERHGPISVTPRAGGGTGGQSSSAGSISYGDPSASSLRVLSRTTNEVVLELRTEGFEAELQDDGTVRLSIPGFEVATDPGSPAVPVRRSWVEVEAGLDVHLGPVRAEDVQVLSSMRLSATDAPRLVASSRGTVEAGKRPQPQGAAFRGAGLFPERPARLLQTGYQRDVKKALLEMAPLRWDRTTGEIVLARRLVIRLVLAGREASGQTGSSSRRRSAETVRLAARAPGLYRVRFEDAFGGRRVPASSLRLSRQGVAAAFHLEPDNGVFGPGSALFFVSEGAALNPYGMEAVYELERGSPGLEMDRGSALPGAGPTIAAYHHRVDREENHLYQAALLEAPDPWLWDVLFAPSEKSYPFEVVNLAASSEPAMLSLRLQGASDFPASPDHHVRVSVNGVQVAERWLEGKQPLLVEAPIPAGVLREGSNSLAIENVGDTEAAYSMVMLDRFTVDYPGRLVAENGSLDGSFGESGTAEIVGVSGASVVDVTDRQPRWLSGAQATPGSVRLSVAAGRRYLVLSSGKALAPEIRVPLPSRLKEETNRADYLMVGPRELLDAAGPLLDLRRRQGLESRAVALEEIDSEFGYGEADPRAIREFLFYAYHSWQRPAPRYVVLVGDATYDFKDVLGTGVRNEVPPMMVKTSYLWTASDAAYAAVNGEDILPDLAIGRLPAANVDELRVMIAKILAYEAGGPSIRGRAVLVADNPDSAGDFERNADEIADTVLASSNPRRIYLSRLGVAATRDAIVDAFDDGAALLSYVGHGGIHLWASENIFDRSRVETLAEQPEQPVVLTLNCLNGYFLFPYFDSLSEELVKAEGKGAIASISPSGLSLDEPAHRYHEALLSELVSGRHRRLGDAFLSAQSDYAATGAFPELLRIYHLFGDPALMLR